MHYEIGGPANGQPVVLVSGFSSPYAVWDRTFEGLTAAGFRVVRYDHFGRGLSDRPDARYDPEFFDNQLEDLLDGFEDGRQGRLGGRGYGRPDRRGVRQPASRRIPENWR